MFQTDFLFHCSLYELLSLLGNRVPLGHGKGSFDGNHVDGFPRAPVKLLGELAGYTAEDLLLGIREFAIMKFHSSRVGGLRALDVSLHLLLIFTWEAARLQRVSGCPR